MVSLDGNTSFIGTEFIKLLNTGSSHLATEQYVNTKVAEGGGGVQPEDVYTKAETNALLNNKLNVNNPQDILGNLRLDPTNGNSKIILNAVAPANANDDFYCNGNAHINGTLRASVLTSDGDVNASGCNTDTFNSFSSDKDTVFKNVDVEYMKYSRSDTSLNLSTDIDMKTSTLKSNNFNTSTLNTKISFNDDIEYMKYENINVDNTFYGLKVLSNLYTMDCISTIYKNAL